MMKQGRYLLIPLALVLVYLALYQLPAYGDFTRIYYQAAQLDNPYTLHFLNPPWAIIFLRPFILLPLHAAGAAWVTFSLLVILYSLHQMKTDRVGVLFTVFNPFMWFYLTLGQLDALVLLGLAINYPPVDILLIAIKPQVIGTAVLAKLRYYTRQQWLWLITAVSLSLLIWWNWPLQMVGNWREGVYHPLSFDIWPYGVPIGLFLLYWGWRISRPADRTSMIPGAAIMGLATYFLTPYIGPASIVIYAAIVFTVAPTAVRGGLFLFLWVLGIYLVA